MSTSLFIYILKGKEEEEKAKEWNYGSYCGSVP